MKRERGWRSPLAPGDQGFLGERQKCLQHDMFRGRGGAVHKNHFGQSHREKSGYIETRRQEDTSQSGRFYFNKNQRESTLTKKRSKECMAEKAG